MLTAVVTVVGESVTVQLRESGTTDTTTPEENTSATSETAAEEGTETEHHAGTKVTDDGLVASGDDVAHVSEEEAAAGPNPIVPEVKEIVWGAGAFILFALLIRYVAFPKLRRGMDARYASIQGAHDEAAAARLAAQTDVEQYQAQLAGVRAEATAVIERARAELEAKRTQRIAAANEEIAAKRAAANAENEAARAAVHDQIKGAVADVSATAIRAAIGRDADSGTVSRIVDDVMSAGAVAR